jgi:hypothetical protein
MPRRADLHILYGAAGGSMPKQKTSYEFGLRTPYSPGSNGSEGEISIDEALYFFA